jgi:hypothetical protein
MDTMPPLLVKCVALLRSPQVSGIAVEVGIFEGPTLRDSPVI